MSDTTTADIRNSIKTMLQRLDVPYSRNHYDEALHDLCVKRAIEKGYPMSTDESTPSIRPFITIGVYIASNGYGYLESDDERILVALYTSFVTFIDDRYANKSSEAVTGFVQRFSRGEGHADPVLDGLACVLQEIQSHYEPIAANIIVITALNFVTASTLEYQTREMKFSPHAQLYPTFARQMSGSSAVYAIMAFPKHISVQSYIQCLPEAVMYIDFLNDVLSFYKEEMVGETVNYISNNARRRGISKMEALQDVVDETVRANEQVCKILEADPVAYSIWQQFKVGYVDFHTSFDRYRLDEIM